MIHYMKYKCGGSIEIQKKNLLIKDGGSIKIMFNYRQKLGGKESPI